MAGPASTCWSLIDAVRRGDAARRAEFSERYLPAVRAYLLARWRGTPLRDAVDDATQDAFLDLLRPEGPLSRLDPTRPGGFRAFLYGIVRTTALHVETRRGRALARGMAGDEALAGVPGREAAADRAFEAAWALALVREALALQRERALAQGEEAWKRTEILRLHFGDSVPLRDIASAWGMEPDRLYREHARARHEFRAALEEVVSAHHPGGTAGASQALQDLLAHFHIDAEENRALGGPV